jgi:hypothetical protein
MTRQLVFVHGRSQEFKEADALKAQWVEAFRRGLAKSGLDLPIAESEIRFPYYGQTLYDLVNGVSADQAAEVIVRGDAGDEEQKRFFAEVLREVREHAGITDDQLRELGDSQVVERGFLNWEWVQTTLKAIDRYVPGGSGASVAIATNDVYQYLQNPGLQNVIDSGIRSAVDATVETVVVSHSLGTVTAYNLLRREGHALGWRIPLFVTLGAPLAIKMIKQRLSPITHPRCATSWFNAMDERDVVALYPLDAAHFPIQPPIVNKTDVDNHTDNRHGIAGYLDDAEVARRIHEALVA